MSHQAGTFGLPGFFFLHSQNINTEGSGKRRQCRVCAAEGCRNDTDRKEDQD